ncbi:MULTISPECIES: SusD/RagB family nutrient-binding outer membrane lipoprotein [unclassified Chryseobacterium]|uniref:SusD/RagB family nutrient-binding outer membrane lipoprotein n=1 Tax=unclassified Chryseobacterium TaxID=2593645 RepID=UPI000D70AAF7|nr:MULTISPECIES: SusD/RagB family nutrient-binding outer membrane lipoprotein [unclassified Chryseobacterium]PWW30803.1 SusD/RagB-like outer membrane lipoprotein [Chryseobacterium sp. AG844]
MKKFKNILYAGGVVASLLLFNSCQSDLTSLNEDPKHPSTVPTGNLLATSMFQGFYYMYTGSVNFNNYRFFTQQWTETTYVQETNYNLTTRAQPRNHFRRMYVYTLAPLEQAKKDLPTEINADPDVVNNKWATLEIASIFVWENIVDTYGNVPYKEALQAETIKSPKYDDAKSIYLDLITRLDAAIAKINKTKAGYPEDLVYKGDMNKWVKLANSIKLRLAINLADVDPATSKSVAESAITGGVIDSNDSSYSLKFDGNTFTNPLFDDLVASGRNDYLPSNVIVNPMNTKSDPRRAAYFTQIGGTYKGGVYGTLNTFANFSHVNPTFLTGNAPANLLSYTEVLFLKAEAAARGYNAGGTAAGLYAAAVTASMTENGISATDAAAYILANPYNAANWKQSIGYEGWVAMWNNPFAAWNFVRRLDSPVLTAPPSSYIGGMPYRMPYSDQEYVVNNANVSAAANAIGGDKATTKLFWDKN